MRISISNIAWDTSLDEQVATILQRHKVDAIDIAPPKYFTKEMNPSEEEMSKVRKYWEKKGIELVGMQSLLFGTTGLNVFGPQKIQDELIHHLSKVMRIAQGLGIKKITFGSPKNRDRSGLTDEKTERIALDFFSKVGEEALKYNLVLCLEPNPTGYGCNFLTTTEETLLFVKRINHPGVKLQFDTGAIFMNKEKIPTTVDPSTGHIHISEPLLKPVGSQGSDHLTVAKSILDFNPDTIVTIEMLTSSVEVSLVEIERSIEFTTGIYK